MDQSSTMIERTLVVLKPDTIQRKVTGEIITRFERAGLKITAMKMLKVDEKFAATHYEDLGKRKGPEVLKRTTGYLTEGPVIAIVLEGVSAVEVVRKIAGGTEPKTAPPGTIRGDYAHVSYEYADTMDMSVKNLLHASGTKTEAENEIKLWFTEIHKW